jgi:hypothetical protein
MKGIPTCFRQAATANPAGPAPIIIVWLFITLSGGFITCSSFFT